MNRFFQYINTLPMPLWLAMMFAPRHPLTERASRSSSIFALTALNYVVAIIVAVRQAGQQPDGLSDITTLAGISRGLGQPSGALAAWAHMLALDLFTGAWIYRRCRELDAPASVRIPALFFTLMTGPAGLLYFLAWLAFGRGQAEINGSG